MSQLKTECDSYRERATQYAALLRDVRPLVDQRTLPLGLTYDVLDAVSRDLNRFHRADCNARYTIAFAGAFSVGKSHLVNAILGDRILPVETVDTTLLPTVVRQSNEGQRTAAVRYLTEPEIADIFAHYRGASETFPWPASVADAQNLSEENVKRLVASLRHDRERNDVQRFLTALRDPELSDHVRGKDPKERHIPFGEIEQYVVRHRGRDERFLLSSVIIGIPDFPLGPEVELIDLPGTDADDPWARKITHRYVKDVDAMIVVSKCDSFFNQEGANLLDTIRQWGGQHAERLFFVLNKADDFIGKSAVDVLSVYQRLLERLRHYYHEKAAPRVYFTVAAARLGNDQVAIQKRLQEGLPTTGDEHLNQLLGKTMTGGGVEFLVSELNEFLMSEATTVKLNALRDRWSSLTRDIGEKLQPAGMTARMRYGGRRERLIDAYGQLLTDTQSQIRGGHQEASRLVRQLENTLRDVGKISPDALLESVDRIVERLVSPVDYDRDATEVARELWTAIYAEFERACLSHVEHSLLSGFIAKCRQVFEGPVGRLTELSITASNASLPWPPLEPTRAMLKSVELRLTEVFKKSNQGRPYRQPSPGALFGAFLDTFKEDAARVLKARTREFLVNLVDFLPLYLRWHLQDFVNSSDAFIDKVVADNVLTSDPEAFTTLLDDDEERRAEEIVTAVIELARRFSQIAQSTVRYRPLNKGTEKGAPEDGQSNERSAQT